MKALDKALFRDLGRLRSQVVTLSLVVAAGVSVFVAMKVTVDALDDARAAYFRAQRFGDVFCALKRAPRAVLADLAAIDGVAQVEGRVVGDVPMFLAGRSTPATVHLVSIDPLAKSPLDAVRLRRGRLPELQHDNEVVLNEPFAEANRLEPGDDVEAVLYGHLRRLRVVGVGIAPDLLFQLPPGAVAPSDERYGAAWMVRKPLESAFDLGGAFNDLVVTLAPHATRASVISAIDRRLLPYGGHGAYGREDQASWKGLDSRLERLRAMLVVIPTLFLLVAAFVLNVVLGRLVESQREQIGALKAFGYGNARLARHYLSLAFLAVMPGAVLGIVGGLEMGHGLISLYLRYFRLPLTETGVDTRVASIAVLVVLASAGIGALRAVRAVARLQPVEAMRPPTPPSYRKGFVEQLRFFRRLPSWALMIWRGLRLRPLRAAAAVLALAFATALCVTGSFFGGSLDQLMQHQFGLALRADLTVGLVRPMSPASCDSLRALDGVRACEPVVTIPVRLRLRGASREVGLTTLIDGSALKRIIDRRGEVIGIPPTGLLVSRRLLDRLGGAVGEMVSVETIEGRARSVTLPVRAAIDDELGLNVYASSATLTGIMGETPPMTSALLRVGSGLETEVRRRLEAMPSVNGVTDRRSTILDFEKATSASLRVMTLILAVLATALAVAVVYNGARVTLAERARDVASLRVLGYTRGEASRVLLGELALEVALAVPLGLLLGRALAGASLAGMAADEVRLPFVVTNSTYAFAAGVVLAASLLSAARVRQLLDHLDLVEVLKTRE